MYERLCDRNLLRSAWEKVRENRGAAGIDRITVSDFERDRDANLEKTYQDLQQREYRPLPVLRFYRKKKDKKDRPLGIPAVRDRVVQQALLQLLTPLYESRFSGLQFRLPSRTLDPRCHRTRGILDP